MAGKPLNQVEWRINTLDGKGNKLPTNIEQTGIGDYQVSIPLTGLNRLFVQLTDKADSKTTTLFWQRPYPAEYQLDQKPLKQLSKLNSIKPDQIRSNLSTEAIEKDRTPLLALIGITLAILSIYTKRL